MSGAAGSGGACVCDSGLVSESTEIVRATSSANTPNAVSGVSTAASSHWQTMEKIQAIREYAALPEGKKKTLQLLVSVRDQLRSWVRRPSTRSSVIDENEIPLFSREDLIEKIMHPVR